MKFLPLPEKQQSSGRTLLMRFGAFTCRSVITWAIIFIPCAVIAAKVFADKPRDEFQLYFIATMFAGLLLSLFSGVLGWFGYTKLNLQHQKNWGFFGLFILVLYVLWMSPSGDSANEYMDEKLWNSGE